MCYYRIRYRDLLLPCRERSPDHRAPSLDCYDHYQLIIGNALLGYYDNPLYTLPAFARTPGITSQFVPQPAACFNPAPLPWRLIAYIHSHNRTPAIAQSSETIARTTPQIRPVCAVSREERSPAREERHTERKQACSPLAQTTGRKKKEGERERDRLPAAHPALCPFFPLDG